MKFLTVLQTHSKSNSQAYTKRVCSDSKAEVTKRCVRSLVATMNHAALTTNAELKLAVLDDHSDPDIIDDLKNTLAGAHFETEFISLKTYGIMPSILQCYEYGKDHGEELVYFAQDDYLFEETAIEEMIEVYLAYSPKLHNHISVFPFNDPWRYIDTNSVEKVHMARTSKRHWRTNYHTASCFMTHVQIIKDNWDLFYGMGTHPVSGDMEDNTINKLFIERGYWLFTPIPSLALHMQYETEMDPLIEWKPKWEKFADKTTDFKMPAENVVMNVGAGLSDFDAEFFKGWNVVTLDIDEKANPDIHSSITDMGMVKSESVDALWASHVIEHLYWHELPLAIREIYRILKPTGFAIMIVPNLKALAQSISSGDILSPIYHSSAGPISPIDMIYGYRRFVADGSEAMQHKIGFTPQSMEVVLGSFNFNYYRVFDAGLNIIAFIGKEKIPDSTLESLCNHWGYHPTKVSPDPDVE